MILNQGLVPSKHGFMTKINKVQFSLLLCMLVFSYCQKPIKTHKLKLDGKAWDSNTNSFLANRCHLDFDSLKLGGSKVVPVKYRGRVLYTMKDYLNLNFSNREYLLKYLNDSIAVAKSIRIFESYTLHKGIRYSIQVDEGRVISFEVKNGSLSKTKEEDRTEIDPMINPLDSGDCFTSFVSLPQRFSLWSVYNQKDKIEIYQASLFE